MSDLILSPIPVRPCIKCGATERYKNGDCKACSKATGAAWRAANPDKVKAASGAWAAANPEKAKARMAAWYAANKDKVSAQSAARYAANPEKIKARSAAWYAANPGKAKASNAAWGAANPDKKRAMSAEWYASNPDKVKTQRAAWTAANPGAKLIYGHNYRARTRAAGGTLSKDLAAKLFKLQKGKCPCCKQPLGDDYHLDHITPLFLGGTNSDENIQLLRAKCNMQKSKKEPIQFMQSRGFLI